MPTAPPGPNPTDAPRRGRRMPLGLRVVLLVTAFNVAVFGGGLAWLTERLGGERAEGADVVEELVRERLRTRLEARGEGLAGPVLSWTRWDRYEDALLVQLQEEVELPALPDMRAVARSGRPRLLPRGVAFPLRRPHPTPRRVDLPGPRLPDPWSLDARDWPLGPAGAVVDVATVLARRGSVPYLVTRPPPGEVWGACFVNRFWFWPWQLPAVMGDALFLGMPPSRQTAYDKRLSHLHRRMLEAARDGRTPIVLYHSEVILPLRAGGQVVGSVLIPTPLWRSLVPGPLFAPWRWARGPTVDMLPAGGGPRLRAEGVYLNPMGSAHRPATWDEEAVLADLRRAAGEDRTIESAGGLAVPLRLASGQVWGGVWLRPRRESVARALLRELAPWFVLTTVALTLATFIGVHRLVLDPVRRLARGATRLARGELSARIPEMARRDELAELVRHFNAMASQVEGFNARLADEVERATAAAREAEAAAMTQRRLAATGELAAGIAHEINNPLGGMLNALETLRRSDLDPERRREYLELVEGGLERIRATVGKVLRLAPRETRTTLVALADPVADALGLVRHRAAQQGTALRLDGAGGGRAADSPEAFEPWRALPPVRGQQNELGQAVLNLLVNALDALGSAGEVTVSLEQRGEELVLAVADDGPGMPPELLPRAADLFFTTKEADRGTGLGLAIVHNVVANHGGSVRLSNVPGGGFRAELTLPTARGGEAGP